MNLLRWVGWFGPVAILGVACAGASADSIRLQGGGTMQGVVEPDPLKPGYVQIWTASSSSPLVMKKDRVAAIERDETPLRPYLERRRALAETAEAQLDLAGWCELSGLAGLAQFHYKEALRLDPQNATANQKLGRVQIDGRWLTRDEAREAQGLVKLDGRWVTPEQKLRAEQAEQQSIAQRTWSRRIGLMVEQYRQGDDVHRAEAEQQLRAITEPEAVIPLVNILGQGEPGLRTLLAEILAGIADPKASQGLVHRVLAEEDPLIRQYTLGFLVQRADPEVIGAFTRVLAESDVNRVGRAAAALAALNAEGSVPRLVPALVSIQKRVEIVMAPAPSGGGGMGFNAGFSRQQGISRFSPLGLQNGSARSSTSGSISGPANGVGFFGDGYSFPVLTGPVTAPGVVAFGVTAAPVYGGVGFSTGGGGSPNLVPTQVVVPYQHQNAEVLQALVKLTGRNFGFDVAAWKRWLRTDYRPPTQDQPERRVPQP